MLTESPNLWTLPKQENILVLKDQINLRRLIIFRYFLLLSAKWAFLVNVKKNNNMGAFICWLKLRMVVNTMVLTVKNFNFSLKIEKFQIVHYYRINSHSHR